jgi:UDPglucose 6-dehydrogenase
MNILIVGTGYVGTTTALVFCEMGHKVTGLDLDKQKLALLKSGKLYFYEPGLDNLLLKHVQQNNITFTNNTEKAMKENDVIYICVGTPQGKDGNADLFYVKSVAHSIGLYMNTYKVVVDKSTVPVGTAEMVTKWIKEKQTTDLPFDVVSNPEFLREGSALQDALYPDRIVVGSTSAKANNIMKELYNNYSCPIVETTPKAAELIKYAANSFLAAKISYINEIAKLCDALHINVKDVSKGIGLDHRIGKPFLNAGIGYGGSCFPKDVSALIYAAKANGMNLEILETAVKINELQPLYFLNKAISNMGPLKNKKIAILGVSFKPETDDMRESPAIKMIDKLIEWESIVKVHDPVARIQNDKVKQCITIEETIEDADAVFICTDWDQYKNIKWEAIHKLMKSPYIFDGRNLLNPDEMKKLGFFYYGIGFE